MEKLLIIADQNAPGTAIPRGLELAAKLTLQAEVVAFTYAPLQALSTNERAVVKKQLITVKTEEIQARIDRHAGADQKVKLKVVWQKDVASWTVDQCEKGGYAMLLKTGRQSGTASHSSTDWHLLRESSVPVLIVAKNKWTKTRPVLASLDLASKSSVKKKLNQQILQRASAIAEAMAVDLKVVSVIDVPTVLADLDLIDEYSYIKSAKAAMQPQIKALSKQYSIAEDVFEIKDGPIEKVITSEAASQRAQLLVMGCVGRKGIKARLLGNTAEKVLTLLKTDVLALKPR